MNKFKSKLIAAAVVTTMVLPMSAAYAAPKGMDKKVQNSVKHEQKMVDKLQKQQTKMQQKAQKDQLKAQMKQKRLTMQQNNAKLHTLKMQIIQNKLQINFTINAIRKNNIVVSNDLLTQIQAQVNVIKTDVQNIENINNDINTEVSGIKLDLDDKDVTGVATGLDNVVSIQDQRYAALTKLNDDLKALLALLQQALQAPQTQTPAPTTGTTPAPTTGTTTTTTPSTGTQPAGTDSQTTTTGTTTTTAPATTTTNTTDTTSTSTTTSTNN